MSSVALGTQLNDRFLWYDGESSYAPKDVVRLSRSRLIKHVTAVTEEIEAFNQHVQAKDAITVKADASLPQPKWILPPDIEEMDLIGHIAQLHNDRFGEFKDFEQREERLASELVEYQKHALFPLLRHMIHVINTLNSRNAVWGIGRGSSVSSYVLFVIGVHDVDSHMYELCFTDFIT